ncbi:ATP-binding protein [Flavobacterium amnicola]|uniref:ATP-binding protein n=1 Tax=Flavobacterium amnicola TaxID=2506422 RepID=UPI0013E98BC2|nr:ATP-binding protein [Flavobacterium amnicola]
MILFFTLYIYTIWQEKKDFQITTSDFQKEIESLLKSNWQSYENQVNDMSFWDDFVKYTHEKDKKWFDFYVGTAIDVYKLDLVSVYDLKGNLIDANTSNNYNPDIIPKDFFSLLYQKKYLTFFIKNGNRVYKVYGATIHPSNDPKKIQKPAGYFFMALCLDDVYFKKMQHISSAQNCSITFGKVQSDSKNVSFSKELTDWKGNFIGNFYFNKKYHKDFTTSKIILQIIIVAFIINLLVFFYFSRKWFYTPLQLITNILESGNNSKIRELQKISGEFGHIGDLFEDNNNQKSRLINAKLDAEKSDKLKSAFLANLSHEIRTPINAINGFSELLLNTKTNTEEKKEYLNVINKSGQNLINIIDDLIEMSKIESNLIAPNYTAIDLEASVKEVFESIKVTIDPDKKIELQLIPSEQKPLHDIITDETKLKQIITNLVTNAIKFTEKGTVTLGYNVNEALQTIQFYVNDTGIGINEENLDKIFERFRRIESDLSIKVGGLGLGLSISKAYIELLEGTITLESKIGEGSRFYFTIPLLYELNVPKKTRKAKEIKALNDAKHTILIAEDDNINFLLFQKIIADFNYTIIRAKDGLEAVTICKNNPEINLILMDIKMPILSGFEAILQIRPIYPKIPIIAQTAYSSEEDKIKIEKAGFTDYISKPLNRTKLNTMINNYLNMNSSTNE